MSDSTLKPVVDQIQALYEGGLEAAECVESARRLTDFLGLLLECAKDNEAALDDTL